MLLRLLAAGLPLRRLVADVYVTANGRLATDTHTRYPPQRANGGNAPLHINQIGMESARIICK